MCDPWKQKLLGSIADIFLSGVDKHVLPGEMEVRLCNYLDVYRNRRLTSKMEFSSGSATPGEVARLKLQKGDVVITKDSETPDDIGVPSMVQEDLTNVVCGYHLALVRPKRCVDSRYLLHYLQGEDAKRYFLRMANGLTRFGLGARAVSALPIALPDLEEQAGIAEILDAVDAVLESALAAIERARAIRQALAQRVFVEGTRGERLKKTAIGLMPQSWSVLPVSDVVTAFEYGLSVPMETAGHTPILRMGNIQDGDVRLVGLKYVSLPDQLVKRYRVRRGDVFFNRTNSQEWVGKVGIYRHDTEAVFASYLIRLVPDQSRVDGQFLGHVLNSYQAQCRIKRYATPGVQQVNINATNLGKVLIPIPDGPDGLEAQREIAAILETASGAVRTHQAVLDAQQGLKKSLLHHLLSREGRDSCESQAVTS